MLAIVGFFRLVAVAIMLVFGLVLILLCRLLPFRTRQGNRWSAMVALGMARRFLWLLNIRLSVPDAKAIREHEGLLLANHLSFVDIIVLFSISPMRFLSTAGVRRLPVIGPMAAALDTIFVRRGDKESRTAARQELIQQLGTQRYPPLALFPEGKIGPGAQVQEFRHGAFEVAIQTHAKCLPCAIIYNPLTPLHYYDPHDTLPGKVWRIATYAGGIDATVIPLAPLDPTLYDAAPKMAEDAHDAISASYTAYFKP